MFYCRCCQSLIVGWGLNSSIFWGVGAEENHDSSSNRRMVVGQSLVSLVGRWSIIDLGESRIFYFIVRIDRWQQRFESAAVGVRPRRWESSRKRYLCQSTASLISDLDGTAATVDAIHG